VFDLPASDAGRRISLEFDGAYRDTMVVFNGNYIGRHTVRERLCFRTSSALTFTRPLNVRPPREFRSTLMTFEEMALEHIRNAFEAASRSSPSQ
jgi:hypothetical protein